MHKSHLVQTGWTLSLLFAILYLICLGWSYILTDAAAKTLHQQLLAVTFPGFTWLTLGSFILGLVLSFVYGWIVAALFVSINKFCCGKTGAAKSCCRE